MWLRILVGFILVALIAPILVIIPLSFTSVSFFRFPPPGFSLQWYSSFSENQEWVDGLFRSVYVAVLTAITSTILGTMAATAVTRLNFRGKKLFMSLMVAPMIIPIIIVGIALYHSFAPLKLTNSLTGLVLSHSVLAIPIVFVTITASLRGVDRNLELAAMSLGATPIGAFFKITLPLIRPAMLSGCLFAFITSLDELVVTIFIAGARTKTLPIVMWENLRAQVDPTIAAVSTILIIGTIALFAIQAWVSSRAAKLHQES
ncbi:ABC transporter permease [Aneurinibacillus tyrosinisolvens]|uniref:ABC transporter permease n=1 Tax=Aneurinibacillus tyrosinisolvens TaxID=1443435 RepID=UPI00063F0CDE|nr:ABC transporter permease [Aneurinibacillus tyrosinisolvens]